MVRQKLRYFCFVSERSEQNARVGPEEVLGQLRKDVGKLEVAKNALSLKLVYENSSTGTCIIRSLRKNKKPVFSALEKLLTGRGKILKVSGTIRKTKEFLVKNLDTNYFAELLQKQF